jgi:hypothetical protein
MADTATKQATDTSTLEDIITDMDEEKKAALAIFKTSLVDFLTAKSEVTLDIIDDYNGVLISLISSDNKFKKELENTMYENEEVLTTNKFALNKKVKTGVIGNWLKDFIQQLGTARFDNVKLTGFITNSTNTRGLAPEEKLRVRKLLMLYRNIKFFPESMKGVPVEQWEIIPVHKESLGGIKLPEKAGVPRTREEIEIETLKLEEEKYKEGSLERMALEEEVDRKQKVEDLKAEINKYPEKSLERMALEEELEMINKED